MIGSLIFPKASLLEQIALGGTIHTFQAVAFGVALTLVAEVILQVLGRVAAGLWGRVRRSSGKA